MPIGIPAVPQWVKYPTAAARVTVGVGIQSLIWNLHILGVCKKKMRKKEKEKKKLIQ